MKSKKPVDLFAIPQKKYATDSKTLGKMSTSGLKDVVSDQQKYIAGLVERIGMLREHCQKMQDKIDELEEKNQVVSGQMGRINNEHEELSIKFDMLQNNLETVTTQQQFVLAQEIEFLKQQGVNSEQIRCMEDLFGVYRAQATLSGKIQMQNKKLKETVAKLQDQLYSQEERRESEGDQLTQKQPVVREQAQKEEEKSLNTQHSSQVEAPTLTQQSDGEALTVELQKAQQQILELRQQLDEASEESAQVQSKLEAYSRQFAKINAVRHKQKEENEDNVAQLNEEIDVLSGQLKKAGSIVERKRAECKELKEQQKDQEDLIKSLEGQLAKEKEDRQKCEGLLKDNNETQLGQLMEMKQQTQKELDLAQEKIAKLNKEMASLQSEMKSLKSSNASLIEEKSLIQENVNTCLNASEEEAQRSKRIQAQAQYQISGLKQSLSQTQEELNNLQQEAQKLRSELEQKAKKLLQKEGEYTSIKSELTGLSRDKQTFDQLLGQKEEDNKIRIRKYESELNQQRIKMDSLTRKMNNLEAKGEESRQSMDKMYEQLLSKDKKVAHMEIKLKEYKYLIQVLRKEKQDIENTYQNRLSTMQSPSLDLPPPSKDSVDSEPPVDEEKEKLQNQLLSMKEQNMAMMAENQQLRARIEEQQDSLKQQERINKQLTHKKKLMMKELERVGSKAMPARPSLPPTPPPSLSPPVVEPQLRGSRNGEGRQKKIASKAHKGFDILVRLEHQLYKKFMAELGSQLQKEGISGLEADINTIIKRSNDFRDIFEDYL